MKTKYVSRSKLQFAFACHILTLLVAGAISYRGIVLRCESDQCVRHTRVRNLRDEALRQSWWRQ
jgi:hypothetical protein